MLIMRELLPGADVLWLTFDTLRLDVAVRGVHEGTTPNLVELLPGGVWEHRHTPGTFTYAAHAAFFAGFLPTPTTPGPHPRLFASAFHGSETTSSSTFVFDEADVVTALRNHGYSTLCVGGVGFFNQQTQLGRVFPSLFEHAVWNASLGVTAKDSFERQLDVVEHHVRTVGDEQPALTFINVSALHQPNCMYVEGAETDSPDTQLAALSYVDQHLPRLLHLTRRARPLVVLLMSDHGTAYGEQGHVGHRVALDVVTDVPFAAFVLEPS